MKNLQKIIHYLLFIFVFLLPIQTRWIYQPAFVAGSPFEYGTLSLYISEILLALIIVLTILLIIPKIKNHNGLTELKRLKNIILFLLIMLFFSLNVLFAINSELAFYKLTTLLLGTCLFFVIVLTKPKTTSLAWSFVLSGFVQSATAIYQFMEQKIVANKWLGMAAQDPNILGTPIIETSAGRWLRTFGTLPHPNILAGFLIISILLTVYLAINVKIKKQQRQLLMIFVVSIIGLLTTLSRSAILALIVSLLLFSFLTRKQNETNRLITKFSLITLVIFVIFTVTYPELITNRLGASTRVEQISTEERLSQYDDLPRMVKKDWMLGTGLGNYTISLTEMHPNLNAWDYQPIHNTFLLIVAELGIPFSIILLGFVMWRFKLNKKSESSNQFLLTAIMIMMLLDHYWWSFYVGIMMMAFALAFMRLNRDNRKDQKR